MSPLVHAMRKLAVCLLAVSISACASAYRISDGSNGLKGVPFFNKTAGCRHETNYIEPVYTVTLQLEPSEPDAAASKGADAAKPAKPAEGAKPSKPATEAKARPAIILAEREISETTRRSDKFSELIALFGQDQVLLSIALTKIGGLEPHDGSKLPTGANVQLVANTVKPEVYVDYAHPRYFNASVPWVGSTHATAEIAADGTLSKADVQIESKTAETLLGLLPIKELLTAKLNPGAAAAVAGGGTQEGTLVLVVESRFMKHTVSELAALASPCAAAAPLALSTARANYVREEVDAKAGKAKDDDPAVSFSGRVVLPKKP